MKSSFKKLLFLIITGLLILGLISLTFWLKDYSQNNKQLIDYAPDEALSYIEFDLSDEEFNNYLNNKQEVKKILEKFILKNELPVNIWRAEAEIDKLALVIFKRTDGNGEEYLDKAWLVHSRKDIGQLAATELVDYYYSILNNRVAVLSRSQESMLAIRNYKAANNLIRLGQTGKPGGLISGYVKSDLWQDRFDQVTNSIPLLDRVTLLDEDGIIYWQIRLDNQQEIIFNLEIPVNKNIVKDKGKISSGNFLLLDKSIIVQDILTDEILVILEEELNNQSQVDLETLKEYMNYKYQVDIEELYTFFEQAIILVLQPKKKLSSINDILNSNNYFYAVVKKDSFDLSAGDFLLNLERFIQNYLAFKFPETRIKILPDKTTGLELVADANKFEWQVLEENGNKIKYIEYGDRQVAYGWNEQRFVLANSAELVNNILVSREDEGDDSQFNIRLDTDVINNRYFNLLESIWLGSQVEDRNLLIQGKAISR